MNQLDKHNKIWQNKKILRKVYSGWYNKIIKDMSEIDGINLELGSGIGQFKKHYKDIVTSDVQQTPYSEEIIDAHSIPYDNETVANIILIDVLHHLKDPVKFFNDAYRVLKIKGRVLLVEPFPSPVSFIVYSLFHSEPYIMNVDYFNYINHHSKDKNPWEANQAIPYLIFYKNIDKFNKLFNGKFIIRKKEKMSNFVYPLTGGFSNKQIIPDFMYGFANIIEKILHPLRFILAFRCYIVIEKT